MLLKNNLKVVKKNILNQIVPRMRISSNTPESFILLDALAPHKQEKVYDRELIVVMSEFYVC